MYAAAFAAYLEQHPSTDAPGGQEASAAARAARRAVLDLRMASTYLDPGDYDDRSTHAMLDAFRRGS